MPLFRPGIVALTCRLLFSNSQNRRFSHAESRCPLQAVYSPALDHSGLYDTSAA